MYNTTSYNYICMHQLPRQISWHHNACTLLLPMHVYVLFYDEVNPTHQWLIYHTNSDINAVDIYFQVIYHDRYTIRRFSTTAHMVLTILWNMKHACGVIYRQRHMYYSMNSNTNIFNVKLIPKYRVQYMMTYKYTLF